MDKVLKDVTISLVVTVNLDGPEHFVKQISMNVTFQTIHAISTQRNVSTPMVPLYVNAKRDLPTAQMATALVKCIILTKPQLS